MKVRLNGWQRLWVIISILYLLPVAGIMVISWPTPETTRHRAEFIKQMPAELREKIIATYADKYERENAEQGRRGPIPPPPGYRPPSTPDYSNVPPPPRLEREYEASLQKRSKSAIPPPPDYVLSPEKIKEMDDVLARARAKQATASVSFPNDAILQLRVEEGKTEPDTRVGVAYWAVVQSASRAARWTMAWQTALIWFIPCLILYVLGWAAAWVRRGFKSAGSQP